MVGQILHFAATCTTSATPRCDLSHQFLRRGVFGGRLDGEAGACSLRYWHFAHLYAYRPRVRGGMDRKHVGCVGPIGSLLPSIVWGLRSLGRTGLLFHVCGVFFLFRFGLSPELVGLRWGCNRGHEHRYYPVI